MSDQDRLSEANGPVAEGPDADYRERSTPHVTLHYRPGTAAADQVERLAAWAEQVAVRVDRRLRTRTDREDLGRVPVILEASPEAVDPPDLPPALTDEAARVLVTPESPGRELGERVAWLVARRRIAPPEFWSLPPGQADAEAIGHTLSFLVYGLARYLAAEAAEQARGKAAEPPPARRSSANQICRQAVADRDGKLPLYESMLRGPTLAANPAEYAALAEAFCGYLLERDGPKAYRRLITASRDDPNAAADLIYGKTLEQLQDEWLGALLRGQGRRPVSVLTFARQVAPYLRPYTWLVILALLLMFLSAAVAQVAPFQVRDIIDIVTTANKQAESKTFDQNMDLFREFGDLTWRTVTFRPVNWGDLPEHNSLVLGTLGRLYVKLVILTLVVFVNLCAIVWLVYVVNVIGQNILRDLRVQFTDRLHHLSAGFYSRSRMGDMLSRFTSDIARMADPLAEATAYSIYYLISLIATIGAMFYMSWQLSGVLFIIVPIYFIINRRFGPAMQSAARTRQERLAQLNAGLEEQLFGHSLVKAYGLGGHLMGRFRPKIVEFRKVAVWADFLRAIYTEVIGIAENVQTKLVYAVGGTLAVFGFITTGTIIGFGGLAARFINPLHRLGLIYAGVQIASASLRRVEEILREPIEDMRTPADGQVGPLEVREGITFENVSFSYTGTEPTLRNISLNIPAGARVAFVGPTGAGKSTLVNLIPRFYDVDQGSVQIDGRDIRSFSLGGLRRAISIVSQDTFIFNSTILENIRLGRLDATDEEVIEAARGARLHDFIMSLPAGYDTLVGERGSRLSGGQKQRVSIARALLRNSPILILDEATSSLDAETESEILSELDEVTKGKTVISITHRLGLAIQSEKIYVLQGGRIVEQGSHEELIGQPGLYRKLFEDQNRELMKRGAGAQLATTVSRVQAVPTFSMVPADEVARVAHALTSERYTAGDVFCQRNGAKGRLYLLRSGQVELTVHDEDGHAQRLSIGAPDGVDGSNGAGRMSLVLSLPHSVSARALTDTEVQVLQDGDLQGLLGGAPVDPAAVVEAGAPTAVRRS